MTQKLIGDHPVARIMFDGIFDWDEVYEFIVGWFKHRRYFFEEKDYKYKIPSPAGPEEEFKWNGWRNITDYYRYSVDLQMKTYGIKKIEIVDKGKKRTMYKGKFILEFRGTVITDYQGRFTGSAFLESLKQFLDRFIFNRQMENIWSDRLYYVILKFHARIKEYLDMESKGHAYEDVW